MHHDQPAVLRGLLHRPEDRPVVAEKDARVGREELEVRDTLGHEVVHLLERVVVDVAHDHVEPVVDDGIALGLGVPRVEAFAKRVAPRLDREIDDRGRPAECRRPRPGLEGVLGQRPAERQLHVGVDVDAARDDVLAGGVDGLVDRAAPAMPAPIAAIVSPSTRTSVAVEPSAVTIVPFVIRVRIAFCPPGPLDATAVIELPRGLFLGLVLLRLLRGLRLLVHCSPPIRSGLRAATLPSAG